jgi:uncharacterized tellurite resistance protein B-like protein
MLNNKPGKRNGSAGCLSEIEHERKRSMSDHAFILDLAKLVVSAAWADGELANDEVNALKDLLFSIGEVSTEDWAVLTMYLESPPSDAERAELLERVLQAVRTEKDKALVLETLEQLFRCDGKITPEERFLLENLKSDISGIATGVVSGFSRSLKSVIQRRKQAVKDSCLREHDSEDYIHNTIYYDLKRKQSELSGAFGQSAEELRKLCLATGLLSHIANVDSEISQEEQATIRDIIAEDWGLSAEEAEVLCGISCDRTTRGLDYYRLANGFFECTTFEERTEFLKTLFRVANASDNTDYDEIEEIRRVSRSLKVAHKDFIDAKLTISREDRNGM